MKQSFIDFQIDDDGGSLFDGTTNAVESFGVAENNPYNCLDQSATGDGKPGEHSIDFSVRPQRINLGALVTEIGDGISEYPPLLHQAILKHWSLRNPRHRDSDLFEQVRLSKSPRHGALSHALKGFLAWRVLLESNEPLQTNFLQTDDGKVYAAVDNDPAPVDRDTECELEIRPTPRELVGLFDGVKFETRIYNSRVPAAENPVELVEFGPVWQAVNEDWQLKPFARIGGAKFATESGSKRYPRGALTRWDSRGRWSRPRERAGTPKGGKAGRAAPRALTGGPEQSLYRKQALKIIKTKLTAAESLVADEAMVAANLAHVGRECGYAEKSEKTQERQGMRLIKEVGQRFHEIFAKLAG